MSLFARRGALRDGHGHGAVPGATSGAVLGEILHKAPVAPVRLNSEVPEALERIINKALEKDREVRCQAARDLLVDLKRLKRERESERAAASGVAEAVRSPSLAMLPFAGLLLVLILRAGDDLGNASPVLSGISNLLGYGAVLFVLVRFGLLAVVVSFLFGTIVQGFPITTDLSAWYSGIGLAGALVLIGLTVYGFYTSLGGQPLFGRLSLED